MRRDIGQGGFAENWRGFIERRRWLPRRRNHPNKKGGGRGDADADAAWMKQESKATFGDKPH